MIRFLSGPILAFTFIMLIHSGFAQERPLDSIEISSQQTRENILLITALDYENTPYRFGGRGPKGFDCSAFIQNLFLQIGVELPRTAREQAKDPRFEKVDVHELQGGDLVFFKNTYKKGISHVGIMISENYLLHASSKDRKVVLEHLTPQHYLYKKIHSVKRWRQPAQILDISNS